MHPLGLLEIRLHIAQFLSKSSLKSCILVCQEWRETFAPWLWHDVVVQWVSHTETKPPVDKLVSNVQLMHRLEFKMGTLRLVVRDHLTCPNLRTLNMMDTTPTVVLPRRVGEPTIVLPEERMILRHCGTLQEITLSLDPWKRDQTSIWKALASCQRLEFLTVTQGRVSRMTWSYCWKIWSRLRTLDMSVYFDDQIEVEDDEEHFSPWTLHDDYTTARIEDLTFRQCKGLSNTSLLCFLLHCPSLRSLTFCHPEQGFEVKRIMALLVQCIRVDKGCPNLVSLKLDSNLYNEEDLVEFLETRSEVGLEHLSLQDSSFGPTSWKVLKGGTFHSRSLRVLALRDCLSVSNAMVQDMLCTLEGLEIFSATSLTNLELDQDPRPWVCRRLVSLTVALEVTSGSINFVFMERLAKLERLKVLRMGLTTLLSPGLQPLRLRMDSGMGLLENLHKLEEISLQGSGHEIGYNENMFIKKNWPYFKCLFDWNGTRIPLWRQKKIKDSGDALEDDFQASDTEYLSDGGDGGVAFDESDNEDNSTKAAASAGSKRSAPGGQAAPAAKKKNKNNKSKKARAEENNTPVGDRPKASQIEALIDSQDRALENLSEIEREERRIPESSIKDVSPFKLDHTLVNLESFLKFAIADWKKKILVKDADPVPSKFDPNSHQKGKKGGKFNNNKHEAPAKPDPKKKPLEVVKGLPKGAPVVLILSSSGVRSVEVIRALPLFSEAAKVGKLFAKHLKVPEQVYFLEKTVSHICVGTPGRVDKLIAEGALNLERLELILLDCHRDAKKRTLLDIQEIRVELFKMFEQEDLAEKIKSGQAQVAFY
ncbi:cms1 ribosomal small subunit [Gryganskiella cystojenkinii]|nr:cms1 ribosomal small subunit [Gryganskiella cystojenkinii]